MPEGTMKVVVKDDERETVTLCTFKVAEKIAMLAQILGCECLISEAEEVK